jgi:hypothetical protein
LGVASKPEAKAGTSAVADIAAERIPAARALFFLLIIVF